MKFISVFEQVTQANAKDALKDNERLIFIVEENQIGKAIGKGGINIRKLEAKFNRKIKIVEFNPDVLQFIKNLVYPLKLKDIKEDNGVITLFGPDAKTRGQLIGRERQNLRQILQIVKRYFVIENIRVV